ncbi:unnamed protein product [Brachionus calyciflorus]|uniref:Uncharacterized protein n=1 Tax=Brachionus calyciflorus TaxID=104777 RepID=A0A813M6G7_9BILA|nr:unnamed protein product [Brachionus calyciflorus]
MLNLNNKVSIITGASSGIGKATAILFSKLGSDLVILGRDEKALDETISKCNTKTKIIKIIGDVKRSEIQLKLVTECLTNFGKITTLVNNAAVFRLSSILNTKIEEYDEVMNTNLKSVLQLTQLCAPHLIKEKGTVINVSSIAGTKSFQNLLPYSMSKAALDQFTKCVALELADKGVRVNSVNPGTIETNIHRRAGYTEEQYKTFLERCKTTHALGRTGQPDEVANTIAFLASDLSSFTTGEIIHVDGGRHAMTPR